MTPNRNSKLRYCRVGAGEEATEGERDTPGFELYQNDTIFTDAKGIKMLKLKRTNNRNMTQTSQVTLQSWRANCDVTLLIYGCHPKNIDGEDLARVTDYVVSYSCKANETYVNERRTIKDIVQAEDSMTMNEASGAERVCKKILNSFQGKRVISRPECSVSLLNLPLVECSETIENVSISSYQRITTGKKVGNKQFVHKYGSRKGGDVQNLSLYEYFHIVKNTDKERKKGNIVIPNPTGRKVRPVYPVTTNYAESMLILHKPWSDNNKLDFMVNPSNDAIEEFHKFLNSDKCPSSVSNRYQRALMRYRMNVSPEVITQGPEENEDLEMCDDELRETLTAMNSLQKDSDLFDVNALDKGLDYDWSQDDTDEDYVSLQI